MYYCIYIICVGPICITYVCAPVATRLERRAPRGVIPRDRMEWENQLTSKSGRPVFPATVLCLVRACRLSYLLMLCWSFNCICLRSMMVYCVFGCCLLVPCLSFASVASGMLCSCSCVCLSFMYCSISFLVFA